MANLENKINTDWVVLKFGGTSVSKLEYWLNIAEIVHARLEEGLRPLVVHSAIAGASKLLRELLPSAALGQHAQGYKKLCDKHIEFARELGVDGKKILKPYFEKLDAYLSDVHLLGEASSTLEAKILSLGELMSTSVGAAWLSEHELFANKTPVQWLDARSVLKSEKQPNKSDRSQILSAVCAHEFEAGLHEKLTEMDGVVLTQGFIARDSAGQDVILGWGGSDTSAAYFAAKLAAQRLEIWTDVAGVFSADPRLVSGAKLLRELRYDELQEIASMGASVVHPRAITPARKNNIPIYIRSTLQPSILGTKIADDVAYGEPQVKAITVRRGTVLISLESFGMWHEVGFLADVFGIFRDSGLSVDLISTSEANVTITLDANVNALNQGALSELEKKLSAICRVKIINSTAVVSVIGAKIRAILHEIGPALEVFEENPIYMVSQAASDLNLSFVVDENRAEQLVKKLHATLVSSNQGRLFGPTAEAIGQMDNEEDVTAQPLTPQIWWKKSREKLLQMAGQSDSIYVYDTNTVDEALARLNALKNVDRVFYAMKSNNHENILERVEASGIGFECVSPNEVKKILSLFPDIARDRILFTPNFAPKAEYADALENNIQVTIDNLFPLKNWPELFAGREILIRVDPGMKKGHHRHVRTGGKLAKFGIPLEDISIAVELAKECSAKIVGIHSHVGSGILDPENWNRIGEVLLSAVESLPSLKYLNLGGGLGVAERPSDTPLDLGLLDNNLAPLKEKRPHMEIWLEPGRYVVAEAGVLLSRVTQVKSKENLTYVGLSTGMNSLLRPALYGSYHEIVNLTRLSQGSSELTTVVGPICESGDRLGSDRLLPPSSEGDVMLIATVGAYGAVMSSNYNMREPAAEKILSGDG